MTNEEFLQLLKNPNEILPEHTSELKEITGYYPFFAQAQMLYAKALLSSKSVHTERHIRMATIYCSDKHWFYFYLYPEKKPLGEDNQHERTAKYQGSYFDFINNAGSNEEEISLSLKNLAERLKQARQLVLHESNEKTVQKSETSVNKQTKVEFSLPDYYLNETRKEDITEEQAKKYISERKYAEAIEILKKLNLINPKKSVYFADQIRFLEKVLANIKK